MMLKDPYIVKRCAEIEVLLTDAASWASNNEKLGAHLAAYISVLIMGVLEDCIEHLVAIRVNKTQDHEIQHYVVHTLDRFFKNPNRNAISGLLKEFSEDYQRKFRERISYDGSEATALESIRGNKNSLAHVGTEKLQMTVSDVDDYYNRIIPILQVLEDILT